MMQYYQADGEHCPGTTSAAAPPSAICGAPGSISFTASLLAGSPAHAHVCAKKCQAFPPLYLFNCLKEPAAIAASSWILNSVLKMPTACKAEHCPKCYILCPSRCTISRRSTLRTSFNMKMSSLLKTELLVAVNVSCTSTSESP